MRNICEILFRPMLLEVSFKSCFPFLAMVAILFNVLKPLMEFVIERGHNMEHVCESMVMVWEIMLKRLIFSIFSSVGHLISGAGLFVQFL